MAFKAFLRMWRRHSVVILLLAFAALLIIAVALIFQGLYIIGAIAALLSLIPPLKISNTFLRYRQNSSYLLSALEAEDFSFRYSDGLCENYDEMDVNDYLNKILRILEGMHDEMIEKEKYFEILLNSTESGIIVADSAGKVHQCNNAACKLFGMPVIKDLSQLSRVHPKLRDMLTEKDLAPTLEINTTRGKLELAVKRTTLPLYGKALDVYTLNDIHLSLDNKELDSWNRLTRTLTHEIMNSLTPITSICDSLQSLPDMPMEEVKKNLSTIGRTSKGLLRFVESYRSFMKVPEPMPTLFYVKPFLERMIELAKHQFPDCNVEISLLCLPGDMLLYADEHMSMQIVTNILKNAMRACQDTENAKIFIEAKINADESIAIEISNNGPLIPHENVDQIFVPFFTTNADGNGIGLSLARRMMQAQGGELRLMARPITKFLILYN